MERRVAKRNLYFRLIQSIRDIVETVSKTRVRNEAVFARSPYRVTDNIADPARQRETSTFSRWIP